MPLAYCPGTPSCGLLTLRASKLGTAAHKTELITTEVMHAAPERTLTAYWPNMRHDWLATCSCDVTTTCTPAMRHITTRHSQQLALSNWR
jgi:hypothetical protein